MIVNKEDLELSPSYKAHAEKLEEYQRQGVIQYKRHNQDTVEALLLLQEYKSVYKNKVACLEYKNKQDFILGDLRSIFPNADKQILQAKIRRMGYLSSDFIALINSIIIGLVTVGIFGVLIYWLSWWFILLVIVVLTIICD